MFEDDTFIDSDLEISEEVEVKGGKSDDAAIYETVGATQAVTKTIEEGEISKESLQDTNTSESSKTGGRDWGMGLIGFGGTKREEKGETSQTPMVNDDEVENVLRSQESTEQKSKQYLKKLQKDTEFQGVLSEEAEEIETNRNEYNLVNVKSDFTHNGQFSGIGKVIDTADVTDIADIDSTTETQELDPSNKNVPQIMQQPLLQTFQETVDTEVELENQNDQESTMGNQRTNLFETIQEGKEAPENSADENVATSNMILSKPLIAIDPTEFTHTNIDSIKEMPNHYVDLEIETSPTNESKIELNNETAIYSNVGEDMSGNAKKTSNGDDEIGTSGPTNLPTEQHDSLTADEIQTKTSVRPSESTDLTETQIGSREQQVKSMKFGNDHHFQPEIYKPVHESDTTVSKWNLPLESPIQHYPDNKGEFEPSSNSTLHVEMPVIRPTTPDEIIVDDGSQLEDLKALLQYDPSPTASPTTIPISDRKNPELERLEDLLLGSTPYRIQSNTSWDEHVANENNTMELISEPPNSSEPSPLGSYLPPLLVPTNDGNTGLSEEISPSTPSIPFNGGTLLGDNSATISLEKNRTTDISESVSSDGTLGEEYLRLVANAKKQLEELEDEMKELREISDTCESEIDEDNNDNIREANDVIPPFETNRDAENAQNRISRKKNYLNKKNEEWNLSHQKKKNNKVSPHNRK